MATTTEGRQALQEFQDDTLDHFPAGVEATFAPIQAMLDRLNGSLTN